MKNGTCVSCERSLRGEDGDTGLEQADPTFGGDFLVPSPNFNDYSENMSVGSFKPGAGPSMLATGQ